MTKIIAVSDLHGTLPDIPECDILLVAGDVCPIRDHMRERQAAWLRKEFTDWLESVPAKNIVGIAGNHDLVLQSTEKFDNSLPWDYLKDTSITIEGIKIWGSPWTKSIGNWAFGRSEGELAGVWRIIPDDADILLLHGPPFGYGDLVKSTLWDERLGKFHPDGGSHEGSGSLMNKLAYNRPSKVKALVFGHIHEGFGEYDYDGIKMYNVSQLDEKYENVHEPVEIVF